METAASDLNGYPRAIPADFECAPIDGSAAEAPLRIGILVSRTRTEAPFVTLRMLPHATVCLGALQDREGAVREWLEIWVQRVSGIDAYFPAASDELDNACLDRRWEKLWRNWTKTGSGRLLSTGWELRPPRPWYWLLPGGDAGRPHPEAENWRLCEDDAQLSEAGLPAYGSTRHRYLRRAGDSAFMALTEGAPRASEAAEKNAVFEGAVTFNPDVARLLVRRHLPLSLRAYGDLLTTGRSLRHAQPDAVLSAVTGEPEIEDRSHVRYGQGFFLLSRRGGSGRLLECFYLKLNLLHGLIRAAQEAVSALGTPLLNLRPESFGIDWTPSAGLLPAFWRTSVELTDPGATVPYLLELEGDGIALPSAGLERSLYAPREIAAPFQGTGSIRIRRVSSERGHVSLEGTLATPEPLSLNGFLTFMLPFGGGPHRFHAHLEARSEGPGEYRFRSRPQVISADFVKELDNPEKLPPFAQCAFTVAPRLSSACDLYSLAVLGMDVLLAGADQNLSVVFDEMMALGNAVSQQLQPGQDDPYEVVARLFSASSTWGDTLGPQHLLVESGHQVSSEEALTVVPGNLWCRALLLLLRTLTQREWPFTYCRDVADGSPAAPAEVFQRPLQDLKMLLDQVRGLLLLEWPLDAEIGALIDQAQATKA